MSTSKKKLVLLKKEMQLLSEIDYWNRKKVSINKRIKHLEKKIKEIQS